MPQPNALDICRTDLFTSEQELLERYNQSLVDKVKRIREMYNWYISNPAGSDARCVGEVMRRHSIARRTAYTDLAVVKQLLPLLSDSTREFHRWRTNEMLQEAYAMAKMKKDTKTMCNVAAAYGKLNKVDVEEEKVMPYDQILKQPFTATDDPSVLGITPTPNIDERIKEMIAKYSAETLDIVDVEHEEVDLEFDTLFPMLQPPGQPQ